MWLVKMVKVNPTILRWARETAGINIDDACHKLGINETKKLTARERLLVLEEGTIEPSRPMLVKMAKHYHRPLITFYMEGPPIKGERGQDFRSLPISYPNEDIALVDALLRDIIARQSIVRAALEDEEETEKLNFVSSAKMSDGVPRLVDFIKEILKFNINDFYKKDSIANAFAYIRTCIESKGIFVLLIGDLGNYHTDLDIKAFRGFALADNFAPFIVINDNDSKAAWSFTLMHELAHIFLGQTGISGASDDFQEERFCNDVAGKLLLPDEELKRLEIKDVTNKSDLMMQITAFANDRNLSCSMVAYNLYLSGEISQSTWLDLNDAYRNLWEENKRKNRIQSNEGEGGPNYYIIRKHRLGKSLTSFTQRMLAGGMITTSEAGKILGLKPQNVQRLFEVQSWK
ncbi:MAG: ImmA/IrrE family metallo-endopeptidase [Pelolinea sp.]|jgi:Zn-dependent peptidase ImmA (M78 family)|nr:ImmA/IrrE family metallo-endopeptidase [Pelolinea sp.]